jgi:long-chain acyl-CoA synthetase
MHGSVASLLVERAAQSGDAIAVDDADAPAGERRLWTWRALDEAARRAAAKLRAARVAPGDRVALLAGNSAAFVAAWFGVAYAGATVVPISVVSAPPEIAHRWRHARCRLMIVDDERRELADAALAGNVVGTRALVDGEGAPDDALPAVDGDAAAMILYTSGTTGLPKAAAFSHRSLVTHTRNIAATVALGGGDVILGALPLTHSFGLRMVMLLATAAGARIVLMRRFSAARARALVAGEGVTWLPAVPTMLAAIAADESAPTTNAASAATNAASAATTLRWCLSAGAPLPDALALRAEARLGCEVRQGYGLTEASFSTIDAPPFARTIGSVGRPVRGVELRIDDGGELLVRGPHRTLGYLDDARATDEATASDGGGDWLRTGDVGRIDDEGRLWIVDRKKDLVIRGGNNVYPSEVEAVLARHPAVAEVAVVGRPDDYYGEEIVAVIVPRDEAPPADELLQLARENLAATKVPREVVFVPAMPLGASGKVLKRALRQLIADGTLRPKSL